MAPTTMVDAGGPPEVLEEEEAAVVVVLDEALGVELVQLARRPEARTVAVAIPANRVVVFVRCRMLPQSLHLCAPVVRAGTILPLPEIQWVARRDVTVTGSHGMAMHCTSLLVSVL